MRKLCWNLILAFIILASTFLAGCSRSAKTAPASPENVVGDGVSRGAPTAASGTRSPTVIPSATRPEAPAKSTLEMSGKITFPRTERLFFETPGTVERLLVDEGDTISKGDQIAALDTSTVISLQKQVAVARVALDDAKKALKDEQERYISGDIQALQAKVSQVQKDLYVLQQTLEDNKRTYIKKLENKLGVPVPVTFANQSPEQLADALFVQLGVSAFWGTFQDYVRRLLEGPWEQLNKLQGEALQLQQTLRNQEQVLDDLAHGKTLADAQAAVQVANGKVETVRLERAAAILKQKTAMLQRDSAVARQDSVLVQYRDQVRDLLGLTVDRELSNGLYVHLPIGSDSPRALLEQKEDEHVRAILGKSLQPNLLKDMDPETIINALLATPEGRDHVLDFFLREKAAAPWLAVQKARQDVALYTSDKNKAHNRFNGDANHLPELGAWTDIQIAVSQLDKATQVYNAAKGAYKQLFKDFLDIDIDQYPQIVWDEEPPTLLLKQLIQSRQGSMLISQRLRLELSQALQTTWYKLQQANLDGQQGDLDVQKAVAAIQQADVSAREAENAVRQVKNDLDDITSKYTLTKLDAQKQATLSRLRQVQDQIKDVEDLHKNVVDDYLGIRLSSSQTNQSPNVLLSSIKPSNTPGFQRFEKDVILLAQEIWGQIQRNLEDIGKNERTLKKTREDLADSQKGPDPLLVARREQEITLASKNLEDLERKVNGAVLRAPFNGLIRRVTLERGDPITAYQTLAEIIDLSALEIEITVDELDLANLVPGTAVQVKMDAFPGKVFTGKLTVLNPVPKTLGTALQYQGKVRVDSAPTISFYEGMSARVSIEVPQKSPATPR